MFIILCVSCENFIAISIISRKGIKLLQKLFDKVERFCVSDDRSVMWSIKYEFYYNTSEGNQKIYLYETLTTDYKTFYNENN